MSTLTTGHRSLVAPGIQRTAAPDRLAYGVEEFAELLGIGRTTAFNLIKDGRVKAVKLGGRTLIPAAEAQALLASLSNTAA